MDDSRRLYFLPMIETALCSDDPGEALGKAFQEIQELGAREEYREGFAQFRLFLRKVVEAHLEDYPDSQQSIRSSIYRLICDLVTDVLQEASDREKTDLIETFQKEKAWRVEYERLQSELGSLLLRPPLALEVIEDNKIIASITVSDMPVRLPGITPGHYIVRLSSGRVLWEGDLLKGHLLWLEAYGDEDLPMAAKSDGDTAKPTLSEPLLGGEVRMDVVPGLQSGEMRLSYGKPRR